MNAHDSARPLIVAENSEFEDKVVRDYRIIKPIGKHLDVNFEGEGKFSVVFKAQRVSDGMLVALKLIKVGL